MALTVSDLLVGLFQTAAERFQDFVFDKRVARYRSLVTGRFVSENRVMGTMDRFLGTTAAIPGKDYESGRSRTEEIARAYVEGRITPAGFQKAMAREIKDMHLAAAIAGRGGRDAMTPADWGRVGGRLGFEYKRLDMFAAELENLSDGRIIARAKMYGSSPRTAYFDGMTAAKKESAFTQERRVLNPAEHCLDCIAFAGMGWQPIGSLPEPGQQSACLSNCRCSKQYRTADDALDQEIQDETQNDFIIPQNDKSMVNALGRVERVQGKENAERLKELTEQIGREGAVSMRVPSDALPLILRDGRFKNQYETGTSGGYLGEGMRKDSENKMFGLAKDLPPGEYPVYGYIRARDSDSGRVDHYGDIRITFKDDVKNRTTITYGDSLNMGTYGGLVPSPLQDAHYGNVASGMKLETNYLEGRPLASKLAYLEGQTGYTEAQLFGGVTVADIERIDVGRGGYVDFNLLEEHGFSFDAGNIGRIDD